MLFIFIVNTILLQLTGKTLSFGSNREPGSILINLAFLNGLVPFCNNNVMPGGWYIGTTAILYCLTPLIFKFLKVFKSRKIFFIISSSIGMTLWLVLYLFENSYFSNGSGFGYFFFLVHYPEYLLGIMLYYDMKEEILNDKQCKICLPLGLLCFAIAFALFYSGFPSCDILSAWTTALATYLVLYNMVSNEDYKRETAVGKMLAHFGKNSYGIFLLHAFYTYPFIYFTQMVLNYIGLSIKNIPGFIIMIPIVLTMSYVTGFVFNNVIKKVTNTIFH